MSKQKSSKRVSREDRMEKELDPKFSKEKDEFRKRGGSNKRGRG